MSFTRFWHTSAAISIILAIHLAAFPARGQESRPVVRLSIPGPIRSTRLPTASRRSAASMRTKRSSCRFSVA